MEIDFPSSREEYLSRNDCASSTNSSQQQQQQHNDVVEKESTRSSLVSEGVTSTSSKYEGGGSVLWPSTDEEGNKKKSHKRRRRRRRKSNDADESSQKEPRRRRPTVESSQTSNNNYEVGAGEIAVDFPTDRTPFLRRSGVDDFSSPSGPTAGSSGGGGIIVDESFNVVVKEGMKQFPSSRRLSHTSSLSGSHQSSTNGGGGSNTIDRRAALKKQRSSLSSIGTSSHGHLSVNSKNPIRRRKSMSSVSSAGYNSSNDSSGEALNAFSHNTHNNRRHRKPGDLTRSLETIHSELSVTQSLREKALRQSLRASLMRRQKSSGSLERRSGMERGRRLTIECRATSTTERRPPSADSRPSMGSVGRQPSLGDLLEAEQKQTKSLVAAHNATVLALPIVGWDVENQSDRSSFMGSSYGGRDDVQSKNTNNSFGLQRSFRRASFTTESMRSSMFSHDADQISIPHSLISSLNNNNADNPFSNGQFLCEEFVSRDKFQNNTNLPIVDEKSGNGGTVAVEQLIMEEEYDPRKPWRKAPAVTFCNRRASNAYSLTSSLNLEEFQTSMDSQLNNIREAGEDFGKDDQQQEQQVDDDTDQDKLMRSSRSSRSQQSELEPQIEEITTETTSQVVNEVPSDSPREVASSSTARRTPKADESTAMSSLAVDDDDSELTELRHAQEALFPIQEGGFKEKLNEGYEMEDAEHRQSDLSDAVSGVSFGVDALENSDHPLDGSDREVAHRNDYSLDIVQEEDEHIVQEKILQKKQQEEQQRIDEIVWEPDQIQEQQNQDRGGLKRERSRLTLTSDDLGANQIRQDLQLDDLPSSAGDIYDRKKKSHDDNDGLSENNGVEPNVTSSKTRVCINYTDESIENEFETTMLEDIEFGQPNSKLYEEENDLDVSELGRLFEANRNDDILKDDSSSKRSGLTSSKGNGSGSRKTSSTLESAIKSAMKKSASSLDTKATSNIRRRNKRLWKFCVWNCRKITVCVILSIGILAAIGVLTWLGIVKNRQAKNPGEDGTADINTVTKTGGNGNGLEGVEQPLVAESAFISQPLVKGSTEYPSFSPSQLPSQPSTPVITQDKLGVLETTFPVNDTDSLADIFPSGNETDADGVTLFPSTIPSVSPSVTSTAPSVSPSVASTLIYPTNPPISINMSMVETDIIGVMTFSEPAPQDTEENLIMFLDALKKSFRSAVSPSLNTDDQLRYVEIKSINGVAVESLLIRRRYLRRSLQTGSSVVFNIVILTECDSSVCADVDAVADDVFSRVKNEMTTSVSSGDFASTLKVAMVTTSGGTLEYVTAVELGDFPEPVVSVLSPTESNQSNETSADTMASVENNSTSNEIYFSTANETNVIVIVNATTTTNATSVMDDSIEDGNQLFTSNATMDNFNVTLISLFTSDEDATITLGDNETLLELVADETLSNFTEEEIESLPAESGKDMTILFNISALGALFFPSPTLDANETESVNFVNATLSSETDPLTSNPANM